MIIFRPHRGSLADALSEAKEFNSEEEMKQYIVDDWQGYFSFDDIVIDDKSINDDRIGWVDTRYVCTKRFGDKVNDIPQCIGMCATDYNR